MKVGFTGSASFPCVQVIQGHGSVGIGCKHVARRIGICLADAAAPCGICDAGLVAVSVVGVAVLLNRFSGFGIGHV